MNNPTPSKNPTKLSNPAKRMPNSRFWLITSIVMCGFVFAALLITLISSSGIYGREFSPQTFQVREFAYSRFPWTHIRLTATRLSPPDSVAGIDVLQHLSTNYQTPRWDVVRVNQGLQTDVRGPHQLLQRLEAKDSNHNSFWDSWSKDHPDMAKVLWPLIQQAAVDENYLAIPSMLDAALDAETPTELIEKCQKKAEYYKQLLNDK